MLNFVWFDTTLDAVPRTLSCGPIQVSRSIVTCLWHFPSHLEFETCSIIASLNYCQGLNGFVFFTSDQPRCQKTEQMQTLADSPSLIQLLGSCFCFNVSETNITVCAHSSNRTSQSPKKSGIRQTRIEKKMPRTEAFANAFVFQFTTAKFDSWMLFTALISKRHLWGNQKHACRFAFILNWATTIGYATCSWHTARATKHLKLVKCQMNPTPNTKSSARKVLQN